MYFLLLVFSVLSCALLKSVHSIINGAIAEIENFKYIVVIDSLDGPRCGGSIINDYFVLTAAHCICRINEESKNVVEGPTFYREAKIIAATNDWENYSETAIMRDVERIYVPKDYMSITADIAILRLKESLKLKGIHQNILQELQLPRLDASYADENINFAGYGRAEVDKPSSSGILRSAPARIIENRECQKSYNARITDRHMCLKILLHPDESEHQGTCTGDSGSPAVVNNVIVGLSSHSDASCNTNTFPTIFTRVRPFVKIIDNIMKEKIPSDGLYIKYQ